jgi:hypothetical protein
METKLRFRRLKIKLNGWRWMSYLIPRNWRKSIKLLNNRRLWKVKNWPILRRISG